MRKNRRIALHSTLALLLGISLMFPSSAASTIKDAEDKKSELSGQLGDVQKQMEELKEQSADTKEYLDQLDIQLAKLSNQLVQLEQKLSTKEEELTRTQSELEEAKVKKDKQYDDMKKRIKFMYENGNTAYLELILEADNFTDMLNKADYVKAISEYDRNMLTQFQSTVQDISDKEVKVQQECDAIEAMKADAESQKESVEALTSTKQQEMADYKKKIAESEDLAEQYMAEIDEQEQLIADLEAEAARKKKEAEEAARRKKEAEEAAAREKANAAAAPSPNKSSNPGAGPTQKPVSGSVSSSGWVWPCPGHTVINSDYGYRTHPTLGTWKLHNGIDVKADTGTPIVAAKSGTVIAAAYSSSMGNYVIIDHGSGITTVYMHCSALAVSSGKSVSAGETIAYVGSTGRSTGPHLHFSVRVNSEYVNPWNYVSR